MRANHKAIIVYRHHDHVPATLSPGRSHGSRSHTMVPTSTSDSVSTFKDGKLKRGIYKIQNIAVSQSYLEVRDHSQQLCCRPATALEREKEWWVCILFSHHRSRQLFLVGSSPFRARVYRTQGAVLLRISFRLWRAERHNTTEVREA